MFRFWSSEIHLGESMAVFFEVKCSSMSRTLTPWRISQGHNARGFASPSRCSQRAVHRHSQRFRHERRWSTRPGVVQLRTDGVHSVLHGQLAAGVVARASEGERAVRPAHAVLVGHQGQGTERGKPGTVCIGAVLGVRLSAHLVFFFALVANRGRKIFEPPRYMSVPTAISQLLSLLEEEEASEEAGVDGSAPPKADALDAATTLAISCSRVGDPSRKFVAGTLAEMAELGEDAFGGPLHSFVIVGRRFHALERDFAARWAVNKDSWNSVTKRVYDVRD